MALFSFNNDLAVLVIICFLFNIKIIQLINSLFIFSSFPIFLIFYFRLIASSPITNDQHKNNQLITNDQHKNMIKIKLHSQIICSPTTHSALSTRSKDASPWCPCKMYSAPTLLKYLRSSSNPPTSTPNRLCILCSIHSRRGSVRCRTLFVFSRSSILEGTAPILLSWNQTEQSARTSGLF